MPTELACAFRAQLNDLYLKLLAAPPGLANTPWRPGGWTRKQIVGHLLDSAANNRQRFVRAAIEGRYSGPKYAQDGWVAAHGYAEHSWDDLVRWWLAEHEILMAVVDHIPEERLTAPCRVGEDDQVTLRFLIEDYVDHQQHHFRQIITAM